MKRGPAWWLFWSSAALLVQAYLGLVLVAGVRAVFRPRPIRAAAHAPDVSILIAAYNEAAVIRRKLDNTLALDYPRERLEIIVASDGSDDGTDDLVGAYEADEVRLLTLPRRGKNATLNAAASVARGEILVFSDADAVLEPDSLRQLMAPFCDPDVGGVAGEHRRVNHHQQRAVARLVWRIRRTERTLLSRAGSVTAAAGQIYAVRRSLFREIPAGVNDDFYTSVQPIAAHLRLVFEPEAASYPITGGRVVRAPFSRKVRVMTRWVRTMLAVARLLNPFEYGFYSVQLVTHKILRRLPIIPVVMLGVTATTLWRRGPLYRVAAGAHWCLHAAAAIGLLMPDTSIGRHRVVRAAYSFDMVQAAVLLAVVEVVRGHRDLAWAPQLANEPVEER